MPFGNLRFLRSLLVLILISLFAGLSIAQQAAPRQRILQAIDNTRVTRLAGNTHPLARAEFDRGRAPDSLAADRMLLLLSRTPEQEAALAQLLDEQQTVGSANYQHWLTPDEFGQQFGASDADIQTVIAWLQTQGFQVNRVSGSKNVIEFSGTARQVHSSFHTDLHKYVVGGKEYWANASDPQIPTALLPAVKGVVSLNNFPHRPQYHKIGPVSRTPEGTYKPEFTVSDGTTTYYGVGPADFATIYKTNSLLSAGTNGTGQTIAIIGETNINLQDVTDFRNFFSLSGGTASVVVDGTDPGIVPGEETESLLDMQWAGAAAPAADVKLVTAQTSTTTPGIFLAANYAIQQNLAGVLSLSYGSCEMGIGTAGNQYVQALWQQAAAQGITVLVSTGDEGSASCDYHGYSDIAQHGLAVNGFASTPYNIAVGGTDFDDASAFSTYWNSTNNAAYGSAKSYIPEATWNATCAATATASNLNVCPAWNGSGTPPTGISVVAASGGASNCSSSTSDVYGNVTCNSGTPKPAWQTGTGVPNDGVRDLPDVSLFAASGDTSSKSFYVIMEGGTPYGIGGTSASAPSFAGMVALFNQKSGTRLGNINYLLYSIAAQTGSSCASSGSEATTCIFNDVRKGNISVPCVAGSPNCSVTSGTATGVLIDSSRKPAFTTTTGYDLATGLGSVNAANLATAIATSKGKFTATNTQLKLNSDTLTVTAKHGDPINIAVNVTPTTATGPISVQNSNGQGIDNATLVSGSSAWTSTLFPGGNYAVTAHYPGDGTRGASDSNTVQVNISPEDSKTFLEVMNWDDTGHFLGYNASSLAYGSNYIVRVDVGDAAASLTANGLNSKCWNGTASCPTGTVTLTQNGAPLDNGNYKLNSYGHAEDQTIQLLPGTYALAANYPGDTSYNASSTTANLTVSKALTTTQVSIQGASPTAIPYGSSLGIDAGISTTSNGVAPTGTVAFFDGGNPLNVTAETYEGFPYNPNGNPPYAWYGAGGWTKFLTLGDHSLTAQYSGDARYANSTSAPYVVTVVKASPGISGVLTQIAATPTLSVPITAYVNGTASTPTGTVTFFDNGTPITGSVTYTSPYTGTLRADISNIFATAGLHTITAVYSGDSFYNSATAQLGAVTIYSLIPTTIQLQSQSSTALVNYPDQLSAVVSGDINNPAETGTITFFDNGVPINGTVTYANLNDLVGYINVPFTTTGTHKITATYSGDSIYAGSTTANPVTVSVVSKLPVTIPYLNASPFLAGSPTYMTASVWGLDSGPDMTGSVTFSEAGVAFTDPVTIDARGGNLVVSTTHTFTTPGTHNVKVTYSGDSNYEAASQVFPVNIIGPLSISFNTNSLSLSRSGGAASTIVNVANSTGSSMNVALTCTPDSTAATCSLNPPQVTISPGLAMGVTVNVTVPAVTAGVQQSPTPWGARQLILLAGVFAGGIFTFRRRRGLACMLLLFALSMTLLSCGGGGSSSGGNPPPPASKTYHFTVKATDGTNTDSQVLTVTVGG